MNFIIFICKLYSNCIALIDVSKEMYTQLSTGIYLDAMRLNEKVFKGMNLIWLTRVRNIQML